ncbi:MAG: phosphotransferase enzyme family protein [Sedimentisphaeraceae bacterium JB056]
MENKLQRIFRIFDIAGDFISGKPCGSGHINDTFHVKAQHRTKQIDYVFQRINTNVFQHPDQLMENLTRVVDHCRHKLIQQHVEEIDRRVLSVFKTVDGKSYYTDDDGSCWRTHLFIKGASTFDIPEHHSQLFEAAKAFGHFQGMLTDLPGEPLHETIPDFHNGPKRFENFKRVLKEDKHNRAKNVKAEIDFLYDHSWIFYVLPDLVEDGQIPVRITHNDTKINNVMLDDKTGEGVCVIDLDTVMPGLSLYDFGDLVRSTGSISREDEPDTSKVHLDVSRFEAVLRGYLASAGEFLNSQEKHHLVLSSKLLCLMIGTRFLTDYLDGDKYFKVKRDGQNIDRTRTQFKLVESITEQEDRLNEIISECITVNTAEDMCID